MATQPRTGEVVGQRVRDPAAARMLLVHTRLRTPAVPQTRSFVHSRHATTAEWQNAKYTNGKHTLFLPRKTVKKTKTHILFTHLIIVVKTPWRTPVSCHFTGIVQRLPGSGLPNQEQGNIACNDILGVGVLTPGLLVSSIPMQIA